MAKRNVKAYRSALACMNGRLSAINLSFDLLKDTASELYRGLDTPTSLGLWLCLKYGDIKSVVTHKIDPRWFTEEDVDLFSRSYQAVSFIRKMAFPIEGCDPGATAHDTFVQDELWCQQANLLFESYRSDPLSVDHRVHEVLHLMTRDIAAILGGFDPAVWELSCRFGPGAAVGSPGPVVYDKLGTKPCVTKGFARLGLKMVNSIRSWTQAVKNESDDFEDNKTPQALLSHDEGRGYEDNKTPQALLSQDDLRIVQGGKYSQAPKSALTMRNTEVQPIINGYAQLGLGLMIRDRLRHAGLDLDSQSERNKKLAQRGSKDGSICTIDLTSASDTVCYELPNEVIPPRWFHAMDLCRTTHIEDGGLQKKLHRFSSMGNGFTFELESLIFWTLVRACRVIVDDRNDYGVFGDDIVCSPRVARLVVEVLPALGFRINQEKSFLDSGFRESCGGDFFFGVPVRPYFYKKGEEDSYDLQAIISMANGLRRSARRRNFGFGCDMRFRAAWVRCLRGIPRDISLALTTPWSDERNTGIISSSDEYLRNPMIYLDRKIWSWQVPSLKVTCKRRQASNFLSSKAAMLYALEHVSSDYTSDEVTARIIRQPRRSDFFALPSTWGQELKLDVTTLELNHDYSIWI